MINEKFITNITLEEAICVVEKNKDFFKIEGSKLITAHGELDIENDSVTLIFSYVPNVRHTSKEVILDFGKFVELYNKAFEIDV